MTDSNKKILSALQSLCARKEYCSSEIRTKALKRCEGDVDAADEETAAEACQNCPVGAISEADNSNLERKRHMSKYQCGPCGYIYDPEIGDPDSGIAPGTAFEDIPDDWCCPICGVTKDMFEKID